MDISLGKKIEVLKILIETTASIFGENEPFDEEVKYDFASLAELYEKYQNMVEKYSGRCKNEDYTKKDQTFFLRENDNFYCFSADEIPNILQTKTNPHTGNKLSDTMIDYFLVINSLLVKEDDFQSVIEFLDCLHKKYPIVPEYMMKIQNDLSGNMRATLIDWLGEVCDTYNRPRESLFLAVSIIDHYLSKVAIKRGRLQAVGCVALSLAWDFCGYAEEMEAFSRISDNTYTVGELNILQLHVQKTLHFTMMYPTSFNYLQEYMSQVNSTKSERNQILYYAEITLLGLQFFDYSPKHIAQACMYISYGGGSTVDVGVINIANAIMDFERDNFYSKKYKENIYKHYNFPKKIDSLKVGTEREIVEKSKEECKDIVRFSEEDFEKIKKLGSGSYGRVYEVKSRTTGTVTAVKSIKLEDGVVPYTTNIEIGILKEINNPHIIKLLNVSLSKNQAELYMVFEKMDSTLRDKVENMNLLKFYMYQLFVGLYAIHSKSIIHRDLKGDNILMKNDTLKIADFGLAIFSYPGKKLSTHVGTLWWRAPEVLLGDKYYGCAIDMWAAGVIMVELLGGLELFQSNNEIEQILKIFNVCGTPTNSTWPGVEELPGYKKNFPKFKGMDTIIPNFTDPLGNDLLRQLLTLDPQRRITALEALQHPFLKSGKILEF